MTIIKQGNLDWSKKPVRFECPDCGCIFDAIKGEYRSADAMEALHDGIDYVCGCPWCGHTVYRDRQR